MDDAEQDPLHTILHSDNTVLVIATLVLAGSALICRSGRRLSFSPHGGGLSLTSQADSDAKKHPHKSQGTNAADSGNDDTKDPKNFRSKERRRRGKDPLKEILKGGKKLKMLSVARDHDTGSSTSASTSPLPQIPQSGSSQRSASVSTSSRSVSSSTTSSAAAAGLTITDLTARDNENGDATPAMSARNLNGRAHDASPPSTTDSEAVNGLRDISEIPEPPMISISSSSSAAASTSLTTPVTSPSTSPSDNSSSGSTVLLHTSQTYPQYYSSGARGSENPWGWDGQGPETSYRKPPRFRSRSRGSPLPPSVSMAPFASTSSAEPAAHSPQQLSSTSSVSSEDFTFPTLNAAPSSPSPPESSQPITGNTAGGTPRVPTPRRTPTPGSDGNTPPPSLNTQTQIASLRGALEAARMREEKAKADLDRYAKDFEMMRWENNTWRRRELELQGQVNHLMHQLQTYAALFASTMSPTGQPHLQVPNGNSPSSANGHGPPSPNGYPGMFPPTGMLSPVAVNGLPFFAYPAQPPPPPPPPQHHQPNVFSMLFPTPRSNGGSGSRPSSSVSGSAESSVGSVSPDLVGSPGPLDRGRRRTRTQTAEARLGGAWEGEMAEGWVGVDVQDAGHEGDAEDGDEDEEDGGFSEALADAILKRPESIRVRSKKRDKGGATEFTFPSISDFGNVAVYKERHAESAVVEQEKEEPAPTLGGSNDDCEPAAPES
ncbi:hypothetical protein B0H17DRAFT_1324735 [Mycena rosella]|uniref:Uncharacterized protein n=1 Tax=Mycena rosella TaxID=1033263 RepID=A0AAD7MC12_MYCRO|nr:hypothetical protein B0H17DRAFT_1324735 [Mycena rosella]